MIRIPKWLLLLFGASLTLGQVHSAQATIFNVAGFSWNDEFAVNRVNAFNLNDPLQPPQATTIPAFNFMPSASQSVSYSGGVFVNVDPDRLLSRVYYLTDPANRVDPYPPPPTPVFATSISLGSYVSNTAVSTGVRGMLEMDWGVGHQVINTAGNDLFFYENGSAFQPEFYAVSVRPTNGSYTDFVFKSPMTQQATFGSDVTFATAFDLSADFGIAAGIGIDSIRVRNVIPTLDTIMTVDPLTVINPMTGLAARGRVLFNNVSGTSMNPGPTSAFSTPFVSQGDPDFSFIVASNVVVPEPATFVMVGLGVVGGAYWLRRRDRANSPTTHSI